MIRKLVVLVIVALLAFSFILVAGEREIDPERFPERPITAWVPWGAGGGSDLVFRAVGQVFRDHSGGQPQLIELRPGAAGAVGIPEYLETVRPNGYHVMTWNGAQTIKTHVSRVDYSVHDFKPVIRLISNYTYILVPDDSPFQTLQDFVDYAKANPGAVTMGHAGVGGGAHLSLLLFCMEAGIEVTEVPYAGSGPSLMGLMAGQHMVDMNMPPVGLSNMEAGQVRALATLSPERLPQLPDLPTAREQGIDFVYPQSRGVVVHKDTPDEIVERLHQIYKACLEDQRLQDIFYEQIATPTYGGPEEYGRELVQEDEELGNLIREKGIGDRY